MQREVPGMLMVSNLQDLVYVRVFYSAPSRMGDRMARADSTAVEEVKLILAREKDSSAACKAIRQP